MAYPATVYRILVASPSDVAEERAAIDSVITEWNALHGEYMKVIAQPMRWDRDTVPEVSSEDMGPQAIINKQIVRDCDILLAIFWTRIGSPTKTAPSGTIAEIEEFRNARKPVLLYFSERQVTSELIDSNQYEAVKKFRERMEAESFFHVYSGLPEFRRKVETHLTRVIRRLESEAKAAIQIELQAEEQLELHILSLYQEGLSIQEISEAIGLSKIFVNSVLYALRLKVPGR